MNEQRLKAITVMYANYGKADDRQRMEITLKLTKDIPDDIFVASCMKLMSTKEFCPVTAEIRETAKEMMVAKGMIDIPKDHEEAWDEVISELYRVGGSPQAPKFSSDDIHKAVKRIGWNNLVYSDEGKLSILKAQFRDAYKALIERKEKDQSNKFFLGQATSPYLINSIAKSIRQ